MREVEEAVVAMPLFQGKDMANESYQDKFTYGSITFIDLATQLSKNLRLLHKKNILHSDLKPANIIWDPTAGIASIVDFNRAKNIQPEERYVDSAFSSDRDYMAPECFTKGKYRFSKQSDVYSLGKILNEKFQIPYPNQVISPKNYLSYDQLLIRPFIARMTGEAINRPSASDCIQFFRVIQKKMNNDIDSAFCDDLVRLKLNRTLISLESYANQLRQEMSSQSRFNQLLGKANVVADKKAKYDETIEAIKV